MGFDDLSTSSFDDETRRRVLDDVETLEEHLVTWDRPLIKCVRVIQRGGPHTVYRRRIGDVRAYYVRQESALYCIGVGKRKNTYDRDLDTIEERVRALHEGGVR